MSEKSKGKMLQDELFLKRKNTWEHVEEDEFNKIFQMGEDYKEFLNVGKTERKATKEIIRRAEKKGFKPLEKILETGKKIKAGDKIYFNNKNKGVALFVIGKEDMEKGMNIIGSHIDSPRLDLKQAPLYEDSNLALLKTHYYGGIKKYQWVSIPLSLHGIVIKKNGEEIEVEIGEDEKDPVFLITDLLIHLAKDQMAKTLDEGIAGEGLNIIAGSIPYKEKDLDNKIKLNILNTLYQKYGITESDFLTAEIEAVPSGKARDIGLDRGLISSYGHDDRVCAYTSLKAILDMEIPERTSVGLFVDKEEIGSVGSTGMHSQFFENAVAEILGKDSNLIKFKRTLSNSRMLSADVAAGFDPNYPEAFEKNNSAVVGNGISLIKYTGSRGKGGSNDANAEFIGYVSRIFDENKVVWQTGELGKTDQGGGGTIAYILANYGMDVVDCGVPVLSMHAPYEIVSKGDVYETYKGYKYFYLSK